MFVLVVLFALHSFVSVSGGCYNENGQRVPWFVMFKMPGTYEYFYADSTAPSLSWGNKLLTDPLNPVGRVLQPIYSQTAGINFMMYNDQEPAYPHNRVHGNRAHAKGVVMWSNPSTITTWLSHSVPNFPPKQTDGYSYPTTATRYGQSFLCVEGADVGLVAEHFYYTWSYVYNSMVQPYYTQRFPTLAAVMSTPAQHDTSTPGYVVQTFTDISNTAVFTAIAKSSVYGRDMYKHLVMTSFGETDLYTETWQRSSPLPSDCSGNTNVYNIVQMDILGTDYTATQDHSKWALGGTTGVLCIGGENRESSLLTRGGETLCFIPPAQLSYDIRRSIISWQPCHNIG